MLTSPAYLVPSGLFQARLGGRPDHDPPELQRNERYKDVRPRVYCISLTCSSVNGKNPWAECSTFKEGEDTTCDVLQEFMNLKRQANIRFEFRLMERAAAAPKEASFSVISTQECSQNVRASEEEELLVRTPVRNEHVDVWTGDDVPHTSAVHAQPEGHSSEHSVLLQQVHRLDQSQHNHESVFPQCLVNTLPC